jgi:hypothetical protein
MPSYFRTSKKNWPQIKRDIYLKKLGRKLFKKHPMRKNRKNKRTIRIRYETRILLQEEIDNLLISVDEYKKIPFHKKMVEKIKLFYRNICDWKLIIQFNSLEYKICLNGIKKISHSIYSNELNNTNETKDTAKGIFSQEEIDMLLIEINNNEESK